uniref:C2H2-type domain-containing protein n=1 Tax=Anopheles funestus TaxID=62324 RepID=A0A4Y0BH14_ANOFN
MMSPESNGEQEHGTVFPVSAAVSPSAIKRMRFASVDEDASHGSSVSDVAKALNYTSSSACAKDPSYSGDAFEDDEYDGGTTLECTAGSDRSSSSCTTVIYGAGAGKCAEPIDNNNSPLSGNCNNNRNVSGTSGTVGCAVGGGIGGILHNNNNSIKTQLGEMDEAKFSEFSKFLADSEKDESMTTILELLHDNYGLIQRYASGYECKHDKCHYENLHEHFHCHDTFCRGKVLYKKYEIIRHLKWHKKRKESLKYGFYRFSSSDDCSIQYGACQHNHKHTHYHCVHDNCDKVYISTSDVQMHANYHRKHEAIVKNGFQRFRATEDCNTDYCMFRAQRTTHFHCRRENCKYTFKNKADMEKHKTYHLKDEMLLKDGYKKFLKTEDCTYKDCRFSRVCNHIHCMHENCHYVLHSSGQLLSHKRKHERMDTEVDYRRYQMARNLLTKFNQNKTEEGTKTVGDATMSVTDRSPSREDETRLSPGPTTSQEGTMKNPFLDLLAVMAEITFRTLPLQMMYQMRLQMLQQMSYEQVFALDNVEMLRNLTMMGNIEETYLHQLYGGRLMGSPSIDPSNSQQHSPVSFGNDKPPPAKRKYKSQEASDQLEHSGDASMYMKKEPLSTTPPRSKLLSNPTIDYRLLKKEDATPPQTATSSSTIESPAGVDRDRALLETANFLQFSSSKTLFNRKRGRPRKNHVMEVYNNVQDSPQAIFTSFKLEKSDSRSASASTSEVQSPSVPSPMVDPERNGMLEGGRNLPPSGANIVKNQTQQQYVTGGANYLCGAAHLSGLDPAAIFGNFSQLLERHMREVKHEPSMPQTVEPVPAEKSRNHLKCVVCRNLFETFADIKNHECRGDRAALDKPLLAFPPSLAHHTGQAALDYRSASYSGPELEGSSASRIAVVPSLLPSIAPQQTRDSVSLVKTAGTFFPDVNANKLKYA